MKSFTKLKLFCPLFIFLLGGCSLSNQYLKVGNYNAATESATNALLKNRKKQKQILILEQAFKASQMSDLNRIKQLKLEGTPANWLEIYAIYDRIRYRQNRLQPLLPLFIRKEFRNAEIELVDIDRELADAKVNSAEFLYNSALQLLQSNQKRDVRNAYSRFEELQQLSPDYKDSRLKMNEALQKGRVNVRVEIQNKSRVLLPADFEPELLRFSTGDLNTRWVRYTNDTVTPHDYKMLLRIQRIDVSPERVSENNFKEQATVKDGWTYVYDKNGNVKKDSLGNDIKTDRFITVTAAVTETRQFKSAVMSGEYILLEAATGQTLKSNPFTETVNFENFFARFTGDKRALSKNTLQRLGGQPMPFPQDLGMIMDIATIIKGKLSGVLKAGEPIFLQ